jgi:hypothetical protein
MPKNKVAWHRIELGTVRCHPDAIQIKYSDIPVKLLSNTKNQVFDCSVISQFRSRLQNKRNAQTTPPIFAELATVMVHF